MRKFTNIATRVWNDEKFTRLSLVAQHVFLYILTSPHCNLIGLYVLKKGYLYQDIQASPKEIDKAIDTLSDAMLIEYDADTGTVWVRHFLRYNQLISINQLKAIPKVLQELPKSNLIKRFLEYNKDLSIPFEYPIDTLCDGVAIPGTGKETGTGEKKECPSGHSSSPEGSDGPSATCENGKEKKEKPPCPYSKIVDLYHSILPELPQVNVVGKTTRVNIKNRWAEDPARWAFEFWEGFFKRVGASDFLMGRQKNWRATFDWLFVAGNFGKVLNGAYDNHKGSRLPERTRNNLDAAEAAKRMIEEGRL